MSPHAIRSPSPYTTGRGRYFEDMPGNGPMDTEEYSFGRSHLSPAREDEMHDMLCIGFGPASLAIAVALHDAMEDQALAGLPDFLLGRSPKVAFLEKQANFAWHAGMLLPGRLSENPQSLLDITWDTDVSQGAKMQISFLKDLATMRNPKSDFTFLNYVHKKNRLVEFSNLGTFLPQRIEFEDYLKWCAEWFEDVAHYSQEVCDVSPDKSWRGAEQVDCFSVTSRHTGTGKISVRRAKHVVIAAGGKAHIPKPFPQSHSRIIHSSQFSYKVSQILPDTAAEYKVAVVGGGQSAAEIFDTLHAQYPNCHTRLILKGSALRPSDDSPFVNEIFNPQRVDSIYNMPSDVRASSLIEDRATNYGVVRLELLEHIYATLYAQRIKYSGEMEWPHRILTHRTITSVGDLNNQVMLSFDDRSDPCQPISGKQTFDLVVVATGYTRDAHELMLGQARHLMPGGGKDDEKWKVSRDYRVSFAPGSVSQDAGVWLQGCNQDTHGLADSLLSILAVRGGELVQSIFGGESEKINGFEEYESENSIDAIEG